MHNSTVTFQRGSLQIQKSQNKPRKISYRSLFTPLFVFTNYRSYLFHTIYMVFIGDFANICTINSSNTISIREHKRNLRKSSFLSRKYYQRNKKAVKVLVTGVSYRLC